MLSDRSRPVIEATLPVVADHIGEIARRFYGHLFENHPELLDGVFNRGNQAEGSQQVALAGSVAVFASALARSITCLRYSSVGGGAGGFVNSGRARTARTCSRTIAYSPSKKRRSPTGSTEIWPSSGTGAAELPTLSRPQAAARRG